MRAQTRTLRAQTRPFQLHTSAPTPDALNTAAPHTSEHLSIPLLALRPHRPSDLAFLPAFASSSRTVPRPRPFPPPPSPPPTFPPLPPLFPALLPHRATSPPSPPPSLFLTPPAPRLGTPPPLSLPVPTPPLRSQHQPLREPAGDVRAARAQATAPPPIEDFRPEKRPKKSHKAKPAWAAERHGGGAARHRRRRRRRPRGAGGAGGSSSSAAALKQPIQIQSQYHHRTHRRASRVATKKGAGAAGCRAAHRAAVDLVAAAVARARQRRPRPRRPRRWSRRRGSGPSPRKSGTNVKPPVVVFKGYNFTQNSPPETAYAFGGVPPCKGDLQDSVLLRPSTRAQWFVCLQELESLAQESLDRRATRLEMTTPSGLPLVYIAVRMDIDDPLWGYQVRSSKTGWLQGFITLTVFTTWTHFFEWNSITPPRGCPPRASQTRSSTTRTRRSPSPTAARRCAPRSETPPAAAPAAATCTSALLLPDLRAG